MRYEIHPNEPAFLDGPYDAYGYSEASYDTQRQPDEELRKQEEEKIAGHTNTDANVPATSSEELHNLNDLAQLTDDRDTFSGQLISV